MSDNMQPTDEVLDDEVLDAVDTEELEDVEEFDPFEGMSDEELDSLCDEDDGPMGFGDVEPGFRSGFVALVGRPNAGKSTLLNACYGKKVAITSPVAQTTRRRMRAVVNRPGYQLVFVDTPGIHKPKDGLGSELNKSALFELNDVDVVAFLIDATKPIGRGDAGEMIKHIGIDARRDLERIFGTQVFLELDVKVKAGWRDDEAQIRRFGYNAED